jgi:N-methylhydantoinase A
LNSLANQIERANPQSIAICLLFSFANPKNEEDVSRALRSLGLPLSISHQILPEFREYERTSTIVVNAYLQPVMQTYLQRLQESSGKDVAQNAARAIGGPRIFVMQSSGGITALSTAAREPVRTVLSGPAGGVVGAVTTGRASGFQNIIAFDMGGTSTDVSLVEGEIQLANDAQIAGLPINVPMLDIHTVGAGGGSLARFDAAGALRVGPESAAADPGPICYGRGTRPTVTDANLLLGRVQPGRFLGGDFTLDLERTRAITREWLKRQDSNLSLEKFAAGVIRVVNATMEKAVRVVSIERGRDPRRFALVAFGGAGGLHACALAEALSIPQVIIPAFPGALSALGILASDVVKDYSRTVLWRVSEEIPHHRLRSEFSALQRLARKSFREESWPQNPKFRRSVDLRYRGQGYELNIPLTKNLLHDFEQEHQLRYGYTHPGREIELVTLRLRATLKSKPVPVGPEAFLSRRPLPGKTSAAEAPVIFDGQKRKTKIYSRDDLRPRRRYSGPAIVTEYSATTMVPPKKTFYLDRASNLVIAL